MKVKISILVFCAALFVSIGGQASNRKLKSVMNKARDLISDGNYIAASNLYRDELNRIENKKRPDLESANILIYHIANCYRMSGLHERAEKQYRRLIKRQAENPKIYLFLGDCLRSLGKIEEARTSYYEYKEHRPDDLRWKYGLSVCDFVEKYSDKKTNYTIRKDYFLSGHGDDFLPCSDQNKEYVYMSKTNNLIYNVNQLGLNDQGTDIYRYKFVDGRWSRKERLNKFNSKLNEFGANLGNHDSEFYFTRSERDSDSGRKTFKIMNSKIVDGVWDSPTAISIDIPDTCFIRNTFYNNQTKELYFESNMPGGYGKVDIWKVKMLMPGVWGKPENLGNAINTVGNDINPVFSPNGDMFFACNRLIGMGGYDIYKVIKEDGKTKVKNMGFPLNSTENDISISFTRGESEGFIVSDRGFGLTNYDVWVFNTKNPSIEGTITDIITDEKIENVRVELLDDKYNLLETYITQNNGYYYFDLLTEKDYVLKVTHGSYFSYEMPLNREVLEYETHSIKNFKMMQINSNNILRGITFLGHELDEPRSKYALANLLYVLKGNPATKFELRIYTDMFDGEQNIIATKAQAKALQAFLDDQGYSKKNVKVNGYGHTPVVITKADANMFENVIKEGYDLSKDYIKLLPVRFRDRVKKLNQRTELLVKK